MLRFAIICCGVVGAVNLGGITVALANDGTDSSRSHVSVLSDLPERVQQLRVDATANQPDEVKDPFQGYNRQIYRFNDAIDRRGLLPVAKFYQRVVPKPINTGISNFFQNISEPWTAINQLLQGKPKASAQTLGRFTLNTLTSLGFADPANSSFNLKAGNEDFGQTLGVWGVKSGPYVVLPLLGPSTLRDATARIVDMAASPTVYIDADAVRVGLTATQVIDTRAEFIGAESIVTGDQYPVLRDVYLQRRLFQVFDGAPPAHLNPPVEEGFGDEEFDEPTPETPPEDPTPENNSPKNDTNPAESHPSEATPHTTGSGVPYATSDADLIDGQSTAQLYSSHLTDSAVTLL